MPNGLGSWLFLEDKVRHFIVLAGIAITTTASAAPMTVLPGEWEVTSTTQIQSMPGMSPDLVARMRQVGSKPTVSRTCLTPEQAARGPQAGPKDSNCKFTTLDYSGGKMAVETVCKRGAEVMTMKMAGTYTATSYDMIGQMAGSQGGSGMGAGGLAMNTHITGKRVGPTCSAATK